MTRPSVRTPARRAGWSALAIACVLATPARADETLRDDYWITNGEVRAIAFADGTVHVGGLFSAVGPASGSAGVFDLGSADLRIPYPAADGTVHCVTPDFEGGYYLGGEFTHVQGEPRRGLAQVDANGDVTGWNPDVDGTVLAITRSGSRVFIGGDFTGVGGLPRTSLAEVDAFTGLPSSWAPVPDSPGVVRCFGLSATTLYVGGSFSRMNFITKNTVAAFDLATSEMLDFYAGTNGGIGTRALTVRGSSLYVGGSFTLIRGVSRRGVAEVDATTGQVRSWDPDLDADSVVEVHAIAVTEQTSTPFNRTVWLGGKFTEVHFQPRTNLAAVDGGASSTLLPWNPGANGRVLTLAVRASGATGLPITIYAGGEFGVLGLANRNFLGSIDPGGLTTSWAPEPSGVVRSLAYSLGGIQAGGDFVSARMVPRENLAALDEATGMVTDWNPGADGGVNTMKAFGDELLVGGAFGFIGGAQRAAVARLDRATGIPADWNPQLACTTCPEPVVHDGVRSSDGGTLYLGGVFDAVGGVPRDNLAAVDWSSASPLPFDPGTNGAVRSIAILEQTSFPFDVTVYAGGTFSAVNQGRFGYGSGGIARYGLAALDGAGGESESWNPSRDTWGGVSVVRATTNGAANSGTIWVGGTFSEVGPFPTPVPRRNAAAFDAGSAVPTAWNPDPDGTIDALVLANGRCYLGGNFSALGAALRGRIASVDLAAGLATGWDPSGTGSGSVLALEAYGSTIHAGGTFTGMSSTPHQYYAAIVEPAVVGVGVAAATTGTLRLVTAPNPFSSRSEAFFTLPARGPVDAEIFDVAGRLVRRVHQGDLEAGAQRLGWDGRDDAGGSVASGVYLWRVRHGSVLRSAKVLLVR